MDQVKGSVMNEQHDLQETVLAKLGKMGGDKFVGELIGLFLEHVPKKIDAAVAAEKAGDLVAVQRAVHSVKSSAGNIGAEALLELSGKLERLASEGNEKPIPPLMRQLEAAYSRLQPRLETIKKGIEE